MTEIQQEQFQKFKVFAQWMYEDSQAAFEKAGTKFLVAMGIFNYIEILGAFTFGYGRKDKSSSESSKQDRFRSFLPYLGKEYKKLAENNADIYDELRCGLTHEFLPKKRKFAIHNTYYSVEVEVPAPLMVMMNPTSSSAGSLVSNGIRVVTCGILFENETWNIVMSELLKDFEKGVKKLIDELEKGENKELLKSFFETANQINMSNFKI